MWVKDSFGKSDFLFGKQISSTPLHTWKHKNKTKLDLSAEGIRGERELFQERENII